MDWNKRLPLAASEFADLTSDRARLFLTAGPPQYRLADVCPAPVNDHEIWSYRDGEDRGEGEHTIVFVAEQAGTFGIWRRGDWKGILPKAEDDASGDALATVLRESCARGEELLAALSSSEVPPALPGLAATSPGCPTITPSWSPNGSHYSRRSCHRPRASPSCGARPTPPAHPN